MQRRTALTIPACLRDLAWLACACSLACGEDTIQLGTGAPSPSPLAVESISLRQSKTAALISDLSTSAPVSIATLPSTDVNLEATVSGAVVSVQFVVDGTVKIQEVPPFTYPGDTSGHLTAFVAVVGAHSVTATPYSQAGAQGQRGTSLTRAFTFVE